MGIDITDPARVGGVAHECAGVTLLVNIAGVMRASPFITAGSLAAARLEMETNHSGTLGMARSQEPNREPTTADARTRQDTSSHDCRS